MTASNQNILVIKLSALGDFVQALGAMKAIREHHKNDKITLLTTKPYEDLAKNSGYFDKIIIDEKPKLFQIRRWLNLGKKLNREKFSRVYDLQNNDRTAIYFKLFLNKPEWVGKTKGASHYYNPPDLKNDLIFFFHKKMLELAGVQNIHVDELKWMKSNTHRFSLNSPYALIIAGCAASHPQKRWSSEHYIELCKELLNLNIQPVLLGTAQEKQVLEKIEKNCPRVLNLCGMTHLYDLPPLARSAEFAIGNDTGPMHFIGPTNCKTLVLFSGTSNPIRHRPLGNNVYYIQKKNINDITLDDVFEKTKMM